jgi:hypothetical protein
MVTRHVRSWLAAAKESMETGGIRQPTGNALKRDRTQTAKSEKATFPQLVA